MAMLVTAASPTWKLVIISTSVLGGVLLLGGILGGAPSFVIFEGREPETPAVNNHLQTVSFPTLAKNARACPERSRRDGAPPVGMVPERIVKGGPPAYSSPCPRASRRRVYRGTPVRILVAHYGPAGRLTTAEAAPPCHISGKERMISKAGAPATCVLTASSGR